MLSMASLPYHDILTQSIPSELAQSLDLGLQTKENAAQTIDDVIRLVVGAECPERIVAAGLQEQWKTSQRQIQQRLGSKRPREDSTGADEENEDTRQSKRPKLDAPKTNHTHSAPAEEELFKLSGISTTSPIRKKTDIIITKNNNIFLTDYPTPIPGSSLKRAFILSTPKGKGQGKGKEKPHWTAVILCGDRPPVGGRAKAKADKGKEKEQQLIFNTETLSNIHTFLSHFPLLPVYENPTKTIDEAVLGSTSKSGPLWLYKQGILWSTKPCQFWATARGGGDDEGVLGDVRIASVTGRLLTLFITRKLAPSLTNAGAEEAEGDEEEEETQFGMIDVKEREGIENWVKASMARPREKPKPKHEKEKAKVSVLPTPATALDTNALPVDEEESEDEDYEMSTSDDGSATSDSDDDSDARGDGSAASGDDDDEEEGEGEGAEDDDEAEGGADSADEPQDNDKKPLGKYKYKRQQHHPLLQPGAMPRLSKAAMNMVVGIVEEEFGLDGDADGEEEEDELDDD